MYIPQLAARASAEPTAIGPQEVLISADSHVVEPRSLWTSRLPDDFRDRVPPLPVRTTDFPGGTDPLDRRGIMQRDTVSMEVLYPTYGLTQFALEDQALQEACFRVYNDWIADYCAATPGRLVAIPAISTYDIRGAVQELTRTATLGLKGALIWHVPHPDLPFTASHYDRLWAAAQEMEMPINLHILTGFSYNRTQGGTRGVELYRGAVGSKLLDAINALFEFIFYGILDRFPRLKLVLVENEIGWLPWVLQQWDYYVLRFRDANPVPISLLPSEFFTRQVHATFFNDGVGSAAFARGWGIDNCLWSNDFPHGNSTWPHSREIVARDLGQLTAEDRAKLVRENVAQLYHLNVPAPIDA